MQPRERLSYAPSPRVLVGQPRPGMVRLPWSRVKESLGCVGQAFATRPKRLLLHLHVQADVDHELERHRPAHHAFDRVAQLAALGASPPSAKSSGDGVCGAATIVARSLDVPGRPSEDPVVLVSRSSPTPPAAGPPESPARAVSPLASVTSKVMVRTHSRLPATSR